MMYLLYCIVSAICLEISLVGLITKNLKIWQYEILFFQLLLSCWIMGKYTGQFIGGIVVAVSAILVLLFVKEQVLWNIFFICLGYLISVFLNNLLLFAGIKLFHFDFSGIRLEHANLFSAVFAIISFAFFYMLRYLLYKKVQVTKYFGLPRVIKFGVTAEFLLFVVLFIVNVANGNKIGYSQEVIRFNFYLFATCMFINSILLVTCGYMVKKEEERKFIESKNQVLYEYVRELDDIATEWRLFQHDYKNVMYTAEGFLVEDKYEELKTFWREQLKDFGEESDSQRRWENLSNIMPLEIKGVFYEKIARALSENVQVHIEVIEKMEIQGMSILDLSRILGIYLDNALEAAKEAPVSVLWIVIEKTNRGSHIWIENTTKEKADLAQINTKGYSTKGSDKRGLGLYSAGKILKKYDNVYTNTWSEDGKFVQELDIIT